MNCIIKFLTPVFILFSVPIKISAADVSYNDRIFDPRIKTVQLYREGWNLSYPVLRLNSDEKLVLHFDLLGDNAESYYYTFIHCDKDWNESQIFTTDYLTGFLEDQIEDYRPSFNTKVHYYHYRVMIPNERIGIKLSGNYIIKVYPAGEPGKPAFTKRFMVTEESAAISAAIRRPQPGEFYNTGQQAEINVRLSKITVRDPFNDIFTFILRNGNFNDAKVNLKPDFVAGNEVRYNLLSRENIFYAGNEYRHFDIRSIRYTGENVRKIDYFEGRYHVFLVPSENREFKPYFFMQDFNGKYYIAVQEGRDMDTEADYVYVYFTLPSYSPIEGGDIYVTGAFNNWAFTSENRMTYDPGRGQYQCTMLLKQGWYNYEYIYLKHGATSAPPSFFEGNHYETENDYLIFVYYRNPRDRYDRLIGTLITNSSKKEILY
ncbi:MAG: type IX secretion system plug protein domain-containing protein [Bacteroidales bacterium]